MPDLDGDKEDEMRNFGKVFDVPFYPNHDIILLCFRYNTLELIVLG